MIKFNDLFDDGISDKEVVKHCYNAFEKEILNDNKDVEKLLQAMIKVKMYNPDLMISLSTNGSYYSTSKEIAISSDILEMNNTSTIFHEMGHALHHLIANDVVNTDVSAMIKRAKNNKELNGNMTELYDWFAFKQNKIYKDAYTEFYDEIKKETGMDRVEYYNFLVNKFKKIKEDSSLVKISSYINDVPSDYFDDDLYKNIFEGYGFDEESLAT